MILKKKNKLALKSRNLKNQTIYINGRIEAHLQYLDQSLRKLLIITYPKKQQFEQFKYLTNKQCKRQSRYQKLGLSKIQAMKILWKVTLGEGLSYEQSRQSVLSFLKIDDKMKTNNLSQESNNSQSKYHSQSDQQIDYQIKILEQQKRKIHQLIENSLQIYMNQKIKQNLIINKIGLKALKKSIWQVQRRIFIKTIIALERKQNNQIKVYLQQAYQTCTMDKDQLIMILGQNLFETKIEHYNYLNENYIIPTDSKQTKRIPICHECLKVVDGQVYQCQGAPNQSLANSIFTNPYIYRKMCFYPLQDYQHQETYIHPYLVHPLAQNNRKICNRIYCSSCFEKNCNQSSNKAWSLKFFVCSYCKGSCFCYRCQKIDWLLRAMSYYLQLGGNLIQVTSQFVFPTHKSPKIQQISDFLIAKYSQCEQESRKSIKNKLLASGQFFNLTEK